MAVCRFFLFKNGTSTDISDYVVSTSDIELITPRNFDYTPILTQLRFELAFSCDEKIDKKDIISVNVLGIGRYYGRIISKLPDDEKFVYNIVCDHIFQDLEKVQSTWTDFHSQLVNPNSYGNFTIHYVLHTILSYIENLSFSLELPLQSESALWSRWFQRASMKFWGQSKYGNESTRILSETPTLLDLIKAFCRQNKVQFWFDGLTVKMKAEKNYDRYYPSLLIEQYNNLLFNLPEDLVRNKPVREEMMEYTYKCEAPTSLNTAYSTVDPTDNDIKVYPEEDRKTSDSFSLMSHFYVCAANHTQMRPGESHLCMQHHFHYPHKDGSGYQYPAHQYTEYEAEVPGVYFSENLWLRLTFHPKGVEGTTKIRYGRYA